MMDNAPPEEEPAEEDGRSSTTTTRGSGGRSFFSVRSLSKCMGVVSSGALNMASTVRSAGTYIMSSIGNDQDQVLWAGFDKLECEGNQLRQVLLLCYKSGFQVWDVEQANDVKLLVSRHDGYASLLQMEKKLIPSKKHKDKFSDVRPLLAVAGDGPATMNGTNYDNEIGDGCQDPGNNNSLPQHVGFYSLRAHEYVHILKFRSAVLSIRCSGRVIAVSQASQISLHDAATLDKEFTVLTNPLALASPGPGCISYGPLALGARWFAYSGNPLVVSSHNRITPQDLTCTTSTSATSSGRMMAYYAKESTKQLAAGFKNLGDMGYKKLSKYCSEFMADGNTSTKYDARKFNTSSAVDMQPIDLENVGMVIVRDVVSKNVIVQFKAHTSPIFSLCFNPSGTLLATASIRGNDINVFMIMPSMQKSSGGSEEKWICLHLYRLQRGMRDAFIQNIAFSEDSKWVMISSSKGTSHLFAINTFGESVDPNKLHQSNFANIFYGLDSGSKASPDLPTSFASVLSHRSDVSSETPVTLSPVSRIKRGSIWLDGTLSGAAAIATGKVSPLSVSVASTFHNCNSYGQTVDISSVRNYCLVFSASGSIIQYAIHKLGQDTDAEIDGFDTISLALLQDTNERFEVKALQKWDVCFKQNRRDRVHNIDVYGDHGDEEDNKILQKELKKGSSVYSPDTRVNFKETSHHFISMAELHMHEPQSPLWKIPKICFQVMLDENKEVEDIAVGEGEIEIERIPTHKVEARSKYLIPLFEPLPTPKFQQARNNICTMKMESSVNQLSVSSEDNFSCKSSHSSLDCMIKSTATSEVSNRIGDHHWSQYPQNSQEAEKGFLNDIIDSQEFISQHKVVNSNNGLKTEAQVVFDDNLENDLTSSTFLEEIYHEVDEGMNIRR